MRASVSGTASNAIRPFESSTAVRQTPLTEIESPTAVTAAVSGASISIRTPPSRPLIPAVVPTSRTIPVNNALYTLAQSPYARDSTVSRTIISRSPRSPGKAF